MLAVQREKVAGFLFRQANGHGLRGRLPGLRGLDFLKNYSNFKIVVQGPNPTNFPDENVDKWLIWKSMVFIAMRPKKHFVFTIPVEESLRRSKQKEEPFPDSEETLKTRLNDYLVFIDESSNVIHVDGTKKIDDISDFILEQVKK